MWKSPWAGAGFDERGDAADGQCMPNPPSLDPEQELAVTAPQGAVLVFAGAGSGKTRVLTSRVDWLIGRGTSAAEIMAITFTRRGATEMRRRLAAMLPAAVARGDLRIGTFHSLMARLLRNEDVDVLARLGRTNRFTIWDEENRLHAVERVLKQQAYTGAVTSSTISERIGRWKNDDVARSEVAQHLTTETEQLAAQVWDVYEEALSKANAFDLDDIPLAPLRLARADRKLGERWARSIKHLLVEDFQDINTVQSELTELLASVHGNLYAVGDDAQSIEGRCGARPDRFRDFVARHVGAHEYRLQKNYRSTALICDLANSVLAHTLRLQAPAMVPDRGAPSGPKPVFRRFDTEQAEARFLAAETRRLGASGTSPRDVAILVRNGAQLPAIEDALYEAGVDYRMLGSLAFFSRKEVRDATAWLRLVLNPRDEAAARRALAAPGGRGIGEVLVGEIERVRGTSDWVSAFELVASGSAGTSKGRDSLHHMAGLLNEWRKALGAQSPQALTADVLERSGLLKAVDDGTDEGAQRFDSLQDLILAAETYATEALAHFLDRAVLDSESAAIDKGPAELVTLTTIAAAKGLEWKATFLAGCEEGLLPQSDVKGNLEELDAERRLFYVGVTRAKQRLTLTAATGRMIDNESGLREVSRFVRESAQHLTLDADARNKMARRVPPPGSTLASMRSPEG